MMSNPPTPDNHLARVEEIFLAAIELDPKAWPALLNDKCNGDAALRKEVEALLESHRAQPGQGGDLLATLNAPGRGLLDHFGAEPLRVEEPSLPADRNIGRYKVLGILGTGGMGVVYLAEQQQPKRTVALKLLRRTDPTEAQLRRFEFESEVLGRLAHPGIAQIYEAGTAQTPEGVRPFIAMELVRGKQLTDFCEEQKLDTRAKLALVAKVADAIHHAHMRGVIHRDLKPANILVEDDAGDTGGVGGTRGDSTIVAVNGVVAGSGASAGGGTRTHAHPGTHDTDSSRFHPHEPVPKILDFGIARAVAGNEGEAPLTMNTAAGQLIGTLAYMSPEQVESDSRDVDARTDVYALGVMLYQLLAGKLPHDPTGKSLAEMARVIRDDEPVRLGTIDRAYRGDIDTIVNRAMAKDVERRYQSAADLAEDLRRCNDGLPILSRHDSAMYVLKKQAWRCRWVVGGVAAFIVGLTAAGIIAMVQAAKAAEAAADAQRASSNSNRSLSIALGERQAADAARARADRIATDLARQLEASNIERGRLHANAGALKLAEDLIWPAVASDPKSRHAHWALWETYSRNPCVAVFQATPKGVRAATFSPSGKIAAIVDGMRLVIVDPYDGAIKATFEGTNAASLVACEFLDEETLLVFGGSGTMRTYHAPWTEAAEPVKVGEPAHNAVAASSPTGVVVRGDESGKLMMWRRGQTEAVELPSVGARVRDVSITPDGSRLTVAIEGARVLVFSLPEGRPVASVRTVGGQPYSAALSPDGQSLVVSTFDRMARLMDLDGKVLAEFSSDATPIPEVMWLPDGSAFVVAGWFSVDIWAADGKTKLRSLVAHAGDTARVAASPDSKCLLSADNLGVVRIWETRPGSAMRRLHPTGGRLLEPAWSADGQAVAVAGFDALIRLMDAKTGEITRWFEGLTNEAQTVDLSHDGKLVVAGDKTGLLIVWNRQTGERVLRLESPQSERTGNSVTCARFLPDNAVIVGNLDRYVRIYEPDGRVRKTFDRLGAVPGTLAVSPSGELAAATPDTGGVHLFDLKKNEDLGTVPAGPRPWVVGFAPDGRTAAVGNWDGSVVLVDVVGRKAIGTLKGHDRLVSGVSYSADGALLAACCYDGTIKIYDPAERRVLLTLTGHNGVVRSMLFSPDGRYLASVGDDGVLGLWDLHYYDRHIEGNRPGRVTATKIPQ